MKCVFPMTQWNGLELSEDSLVKQFANNSIVSPSAYAAAFPISTILQHLIGQRENIKQIIANLLEYKEFMPLKEIERLGNKRESTYFCTLNVFRSNIMDNKQIREQLAHQLWETYQIAKKLRIR